MKDRLKIVKRIQADRVRGYVMRGERYAVPQWLIDRYTTKYGEDAGE